MIKPDPILIVGGSGQVGQQLIQSFRKYGHNVNATYYQNKKANMLPLDASNAQQVKNLFSKCKPVIVVNALNAAGGTDACEKNPSLAEQYHYSTGVNLIDNAIQYDARYIQISTDYVFDGKYGPYAETDIPNPISHLGRAKLKLEKYIQKSMSNALIVRSSFIYSWAPDSKTKNFLMQIFDCSSRNVPMRVPVDQVGNVTYAPNFADALVEMILSECSGLYHLAGATRCSKYDWATKVVDVFGLDRNILLPVSTKELKQVGPRPLESGFILENAKSVLKKTHLMTLEEGLSDLQKVI